MKLSIPMVKLAYAGGFLDGDGCVHRAKFRGYLYLMWYNTHRKAIEKITINCGAIYECNPKLPHWKTCFRLQVGGAKAETLYKKLKQFLVSRGAEVTWPYLAGFFDAEGSVCSYKRLDLRVIKITNSNLSILKALRAFLGFGKIYKKSKENCYEIRINYQDQVKQFIQGVLPYSVVKKSKLSEALKHIEVRGVKKIHKFRSIKKEIFYDLYVNQKLSTCQIARMLGVHPTSVREKLRKLGIPVRSLSEASRIRNETYHYKRDSRGCFIGRA
ncbi:MAG: hypothetical protein JRD89_18760 [Deltaproteobacteria bacterium]|nr:hypothetical protein [Deltaproteobacteria bacterium]